MKKSSPFVEHILDLLRPLKGVSARRMFGGYGLYRNGRMFAIVSDDELFLKTSIQTRPDFEDRGLKPFTYLRKGKPIELAYYQAPSECLDESRLMCEWAEKALNNQRQKAGQ